MIEHALQRTETVTIRARRMDELIRPLDNWSEYGCVCVLGCGWAEPPEKLVRVAHR